MSEELLTDFEINELATYNGECTRGIVHTEAWERRMGRLQSRFNWQHYRLAAALTEADGKEEKMKYVSSTRQTIKAHEATELAKLAVELCRLNAGGKPKDFLGEALALILAAGQLIEQKENERYLGAEKAEE